MKCTHTHTHSHTYILCFWCQNVVAYVWTCIFFFLLFSSLICLFYSQYKSTVSILHYLKPFFCFVLLFFITVNLVTVHLINKMSKYYSSIVKKGVVLLFIIKVNSYNVRFSQCCNNFIFFPPHFLITSSYFVQETRCKCTIVSSQVGRKYK